MQLRTSLTRIAALGVAGAFMALGAISSAPTVQAAGTCEVGDYGLDAEERAFVSLINGYRAANGLSQLTVSTTLTRAAVWMSNDLSHRTQFGHVDALGRSAQQRIADCGYGGPSGENLAAGTAWDTAAEALEAWKGSPGHNANMLFATYVKIGVARVYAPESQYGWYWTTTFGTADDGTNMLAANESATVAVAPLWVNDLRYGSRGGGFYWDMRSGTVWTGERGWHRFSPSPARTATPLWVNDLDYPSVGQGFYLDPLANQVWTAERGWHLYNRAG